MQGSFVRAGGVCDFALVLSSRRACRGSAHGQLHNAYGQTMIQGTYEGLQKIYIEKAKSQNAPAQRPFIIARGGYAGACLLF